MSAFFTLHRDLPREGPGEPADVEWTLSWMAEPARVCDAACGPGADLEVLAGALPRAQIDGVDRQAHFIAQARARVARFGPRVALFTQDYAGIRGPYDLIWCAGAVYFIGIETALRTWRAALAPGGHVAFSEPVWLGETPSAAARSFWSEYGGITGAAGIADRVARAGFRTVATRVICGPPWQAYYQPLQARILQLGSLDDAALGAVLDEAQREIDLWHVCGDEIAYLLSVVAPA